jgi:hypothetical protein
MMPRVSVVIPSRNRAALLDRAVTSALEQRGVEQEVIVVLDGTEDDSAARLGSRQDPRLSVVTHDHRRGDAQARNTGIAAAAGEWVAFLDDDDLWAPDKLSRGLDAAGDAGFVYAGTAIVDELYRMIALLPAPDPATLLRRLLQYNVMPGGASNVMARRSLLDSLGGFDVGLSHLSDWDAWIRLAASAPGAAVPATTVTCVYHLGNRSLQDANAVERDFRLIEARHRALAQSEGVSFDRVAFDRWVASCRRRAGRRPRAAQLYFRSALRNRDLGNVPRAINALLSPRTVTRQRPRPPLPDWLTERAVP